jgi:tetratricopeptide (TPR) repeat protein
MFNNTKVIDRALSESKADKEYKEAVSAFDKHDFNTFLEYFFKAIHSRYDIEKPIVKRLIRRKLNIINEQQKQIESYKKEQKKQEALLKKLAAEYTVLGKECEHEKMTDAAIANYQKALSLYADATDAKRRLDKLSHNH